MSSTRCVLWGSALAASMALVATPAVAQDWESALPSDWPSRSDPVDLTDQEAAPLVIFLGARTVPPEIVADGHIRASLRRGDSREPCGGRAVDG